VDDAIDDDEVSPEEQLLLDRKELHELGLTHDDPEGYAPVQTGIRCDRTPTMCGEKVMAEITDEFMSGMREAIHAVSVPRSGEPCQKSESPIGGIFAVAAEFQNRRDRIRFRRGLTPVSHR
jgi:hypothetical protein